MFLFLLAYYVFPIFRHQVYLNPVYLNAKCVQTHVPCSSRPCSSSVSHFEIKLTHKCRTNGQSGQHLIMDTRFNVYGMYFETSGEDCTSLKAPLLSHDKVMSFTISTTKCLLRETKQIRSSHFWQLSKDPSGLQVLYLQKPKSIWTSLKKPPWGHFNTKT